MDYDCSGKVGSKRATVAMSDDPVLGANEAVDSWQ